MALYRIRFIPRGSGPTELRTYCGSKFLRSVNLRRRYVMTSAGKRSVKLWQPNDVIYMHKAVRPDGDRPVSLQRLMAINFVASESASQPDHWPRGQRNEDDGHVVHSNWPITGTTHCPEQSLTTCWPMFDRETSHRLEIAVWPLADHWPRGQGDQRAAFITVSDAIVRGMAVSTAAPHHTTTANDDTNFANCFQSPAVHPVNPTARGTDHQPAGVRSAPAVQCPPPTRC